MAVSTFDLSNHKKLRALLPDSLLAIEALVSDSRMNAASERLPAEGGITNLFPNSRSPGSKFWRQILKINRLWIRLFLCCHA
jgi:hypothetical protein